MLYLLYLHDRPGLTGSCRLLVGHKRMRGSVRESERPGASENQARQTFDGEEKGGNSREYLLPRVSFAISRAFIPPCPLQGIDAMSSTFVRPEIAYNDLVLNENTYCKENVYNSQHLINNITSFAFGLFVFVPTCMSDKSKAINLRVCFTFKVSRMKASSIRIRTFLKPHSCL